MKVSSSGCQFVRLFCVCPSTRLCYCSFSFTSYLFYIMESFKHVRTSVSSSVSLPSCQLTKTKNLWSLFSSSPYSMSLKTCNPPGFIQCSLNKPTFGTGDWTGPDIFENFFTAEFGGKANITESTCFQIGSLHVDETLGFIHLIVLVIWWGSVFLPLSPYMKKNNKFLSKNWA